MLGIIFLEFGAIDISPKLQWTCDCWACGPYHSGMTRLPKMGGRRFRGQESGKCHTSGGAGDWGGGRKAEITIHLGGQEIRGAGDWILHTNGGAGDLGGRKAVSPVQTRGQEIWGAGKLFSHTDWGARNLGGRKAVFPYKLGGTKSVFPYELGGRILGILGPCE